MLNVPSALLEKSCIAVASPTRRSTWMVAPPTAAPSGPATLPFNVAPPGPRERVVVVVLPATPESFTPLRSTTVVVVTGAIGGRGLISLSFLAFDVHAAANRATTASRRAKRRRITLTAYESAYTLPVAGPPSQRTSSSLGTSTERLTYPGARAPPSPSGATRVRVPTSFPPACRAAPAGGTEPSTWTRRRWRGTLPPRESILATSS